MRRLLLRRILRERRRVMGENSFSSVNGVATFDAATRFAATRFVVTLCAVRYDATLTNGALMPAVSYGETCLQYGALRSTSASPSAATNSQRRTRRLADRG